MTLWPLVGAKVVDATAGIAGPLCAKLLADAGASVSKVEFSSDRFGQPPEPDEEWRAFLNHGKHIIALDPGSQIGRAHLQELLAEADLYLTSLNDRRAAVLGLDCAAIQKRYEHLLTACITPFGQSGPYADYVANDLILSALSGLADCTPGFPDRQEGDDEPPVMSLAPLAEMGAGMTAAAAVFAALLSRLHGSHAPRHIEVSELEAVVWLMISEWGLAAYGGGAPGRRRKSRTLEPNCYLRCRDGYLVVVGTSDKHWQGIVEIMGKPAWALDPRFADVEGRADNVQELHVRLREWARNESGRIFMNAAQARGIPCACYLELHEAIASKHVQETAALQPTNRGKLPADPIHVNGRRRSGRPSASRASWHGELRWPPRAPLEGVRVLELTQMVAGPFAGQLLAALGAEVVIVESRSHLPSRQFGPFVGEPRHDASAQFNHANRGKHSVEIDLSSETGREVLSELVKASDVVLENFSRRAAEKLGLTYDKLKSKRENVIFASISAFGRRGPWGSFVSHHGGVTALTGLASVILDESNQPRLVGAIFPDVLTGTYMASAILQALAVREQSGHGCHLEVSMLDVLLTCMGGLIPAAARGERFGPHPGRFLRTAEPRRFFALASDDATVRPEVAGLVTRMTRSEAMTTLQGAGLRASSVLDMSEVIADPHLNDRGFVLKEQHPVAGVRPLPAVPWSTDGGRPILGQAPLLGDSTEEVLSRFAGLTSEQIRALRDQGVLR